MIKSKFGDMLKNKNLVSQTNELLCKLIAYNITVLIGAMYELKIEPNLLCSVISFMSRVYEQSSLQQVVKQTF